MLYSLLNSKGAVVIGALMDRMAGRLKLASFGLMAVATISYTVFSLNAAGLLPPMSETSSVRLAYATSILGGGSFNTAMPLQFELLMETVYGWADEGNGSMLCMLFTTVIQVAFLAVFALSSASSKLWTLWANAASMATCALMLLLTRIEYRRLAVDRSVGLANVGCHFDRKVGCL